MSKNLSAWDFRDPVISRVPPSGVVFIMAWIFAICFGMARPFGVSFGPMLFADFTVKAPVAKARGNIGGKGAQYGFKKRAIFHGG